MTNNEFAKLVSDDVKHLISPEQAAVLRLPENRRDWLDQLVIVKAQIQSQLTSRRARIQELRLNKEEPWEEVVAEYVRWKADVLRFSCSLDERVREAKRLIRQDAEENKQIERNRTLETLALISTQLGQIKTLLEETVED